MFSQRHIRDSMRLYAVTDRAWLEGRSLAFCVQEAIRGGITFVQLREKNIGQAEYAALAKGLMPLCRKAGIPFVVNDDAALAAKIGADGVHVGQSDMACAQARELLGAEAIVGVSVQTLSQAIAAQIDGADYLGVGAMFGTPTKPDAQEVTLETLAEICAAVSIPVVAIGGLNEHTIPELAGCGVDGVAVVSAIFADHDIVEATQRLRACVDSIM